MDNLNLQWFADHRSTFIIILAALFLLVVIRRFRSARRRRSPATLHPKLQPYAGRSEEQIEQDRRHAAGILATSSTGQVAGYTIVRQIEAVFVENLRSQGDAMIHLKAIAAQRGANGLIHVSHQRTTAGRCSAQGDAVVIAPKLANGSGIPVAK